MRVPPKHDMEGFLIPAPIQLAGSAGLAKDSPILLVGLLLQAGEEPDEALVVVVEGAAGVLAQVSVVLLVEPGKGQVQPVADVVQHEGQDLLLQRDLKLGHQRGEDLHPGLRERRPGSGRDSPPMGCPQWPPRLTSEVPNLSSLPAQHRRGCVCEWQVHVYIHSSMCRAGDAHALHSLKWSCARKQRMLVFARGAPLARAVGSFAHVCKALLLRAEGPGRGHEAPFAHARVPLA